MVTSDIYPLAQSSPFDLKPAEEARVDLVLQKKPPMPATRLCGRVLTCEHEPICRATVKVLDRDYNPVTHTLTDEHGLYNIKNMLAPGCYRLTAAAEGFLTARTIDFMLGRYPQHIVLSLKKDPVHERGVIYGLTTDAEKKEPLADTLLMLCEEGGKLVAKNSSNAYGQYLFPMVWPGKYVLTASRNGYLGQSVIVLAERKAMIKCDILLDKNSETSFGTISGLIKGELRCYQDATVALYRIDDKGETLVKLETTTSEGLYLFTNVENGHYRVKAKLEDGEYCQEEFWL